MVRKTRAVILSAIILQAALAAGQTVSGQAGARSLHAPTVPAAGQNAPGVLSPSSPIRIPSSLLPSLAGEGQGRGGFAVPVAAPGHAAAAPKLRTAPHAVGVRAEAAAPEAKASPAAARPAPSPARPADDAAPVLPPSLFEGGARVEEGRATGTDASPHARRQLEGIRDLPVSDQVWLNARARENAFGTSAAPPEAPSRRPAAGLSRLAELPRSAADSDSPSPALREREGVRGSGHASAGRSPTLGDWIRAELFYRSRQASSYDFYFRLRAGEFRRKLLRWQEKAKEGPTAVKDLEGLLLAWRTKGYNGEMRPLGPGTADREVVLDEALEIFDRYYPGQAEARAAIAAGPNAATIARAENDMRAAFLRYLERVEHAVPATRRSHFRKLVFQVFDETALLPPEAVAAHIDGMLSPSALAEIRRFRQEKMAGVLEDFRGLVVPAILQENARLPKGKRILGVVLLGSFAVGLASPSSDMDFQVITENGSLSQAKEFQRALKERWAFEGRKNPLSPFEYAVPPNLALLSRMHEGYLVFSPYAEVERALASPPARPAAAPQRRWPGKVYAAIYSTYLRMYVRGSNLWESLTHDVAGRLRSLLDRRKGVASAPESLGPSWEEFRRGPFGLFKYPAASLPGSEKRDGFDRAMWARTVREKIELGLWEALDAEGNLLGFVRLEGTSGHLPGTVVENGLAKLLQGLSRRGIAYPRVAKIRHRHTHPSGASDCFSNGDIDMDFRTRTYLDDFHGLEHVEFETAILYWQPRPFAGTDMFKFRKRAFILPPRLFPAPRRGASPKGTTAHSAL